MQSKSSYVWSFISRVLPSGIYLLANIVLAHYLKPSDFGILGVLTLFITISTTFAEAGFGGSLINSKDISKDDCSTVFVYNFFVSIFFYIILFFLAPLIETFFDIESLKTITRIVSLVFVINSISLIPRTLLVKELRFKQLTIITIFTTLIASIFSIIGGILGWGVYSLIVYRITFALIDTSWLMIVTKYTPSFNFRIKSFRRLFPFGFFTTICNIIDSVYENIITFLFGKFINISASGLFDQAKKIENVSTTSIIQTLNVVSFPILSRKKNNIELFEKEANSIYSYCILLLCPILYFISVYANEIILVLFGKQWINSGIYLRFLMIIGIFYFIECLMRNNIKSLGAVGKLAYFTIIKRVISIILIFLFLLISPFSMLWGYLLGTLIGVIFNFYLYGKLTGIKSWTLILSYLKPTIYLIIPITILSTCHCFLTSHYYSQGIIIFITGSVYYLIIVPKVLGIKTRHLLSKTKN